MRRLQNQRGIGRSVLRGKFLECIKIPGVGDHLGEFNSTVKGMAQALLGSARRVGHSGS